MTIEPKIFDKILTDTKNGFPLGMILKQRDMPDQVTLQKVMRDNPDMHEQYKAAKKDQHDNHDPEFREKCITRRHQHIQERMNADTKQKPS